MIWAEGITGIEFVNGPVGKRSPAAVSPVTGTMYVDKNAVRRYPPLWIQFLMLHEWAHVRYRTKDEYEADYYAFKEYARMGGSMKQMILALYHLLSGARTPEHRGRLNRLFQLALEYDATHNNNQKAQNYLKYGI